MSVRMVCVCMYVYMHACVCVCVYLEEGLVADPVERHGLLRVRRRLPWVCQPSIQ